MREEFINEIKNDEKNINEQTLEDFFCHNKLFLEKELHNSDQNINRLL